LEQTRTFMLGWEFPPFISGGLGTACYGLTKAMDKIGVPIVFVLPKAPPLYFSGRGKAQYSRQGAAELPGMEEFHRFHNVTFRAIPSAIQPYGAIQTQQAATSAAASRHSLHSKERKGALELSSAKSSVAFERQGESPGHYGPDIHRQVSRYAERALEIAKNEEFDVVHAHDWMTFPAAMAVARHIGKPLVVQVHSTEFDRSGENVNQTVYDIERAGMHAADKVIAVSHYTKNIIHNRYGVPLEKTEVVYNGAELDKNCVVPAPGTSPPKKDKIVLFLGRITMQKGPEYFLRAAKRVSEKMDNVKFVVAGDGDMLYRSIDLAAELRIGHKVFFTRFLRGPEVDRVYQMADLYVMPSVSEPFGIAPLEALQHGVPVLISKQSGIGEVLQNALKVDFWDIDHMANKMAAVLKHRSLNIMLGNEGQREIGKFSWDRSAASILGIYESVLNS